MPAHRAFGFARFAESLERIRPRRFEQPVTRDGVAFGEHQRLVHQCPQVIERRPLVDLRILHHVLRRLEREAAGKDAQPPEHGLLVGRQVAVAPLQRGAQRLVPAQHDPGTGREDAEAFAEAGTQTFDAQQRNARGGEFDRQRDAVQAPADLDHRGGVLRREREARVDRLRARQEQFHGTRLQRVATGCAVGHGERAEPIDVFIRRTERLLTRDEHAQARRRRAERLDQRDHRCRQVFAVIEDQQQALRREDVGERLDRRTVGAQLRIEHARDGGCHQRAVGKRRELHPPDAVGKVGCTLDGELARNRLRDARLADAARARDGDHDMARQQRLDRLEVWRPAVQRRQALRNVRRGPCRWRGGVGIGGGNGRDWRFRSSDGPGQRRGGFGFRALDRQLEPVAPSRNRRQRTRSQQLAQRGDLHLQVVLLHHEP